MLDLHDASDLFFKVAPTLLGWYRTWRDIAEPKSKSKPKNKTKKGCRKPTARTAVYNQNQNNIYFGELTSKPTKKNPKPTKRKPKTPKS